MSDLSLRPAAWLLLAPVLAAHAAPMGSDASSASSSSLPGLAAGVLEVSPSASGTGGDRNVDLLIQMQPRAAGLDLDRGTGAATRPLDAGARPSVPPASSLSSSGSSQAPQPAGLFGAGADPAAARGAAPAAVRPVDFSATTQRPAPAASGGTTGMLWWLPPRWLRYLRENRETVVIVSVLALALIWGGSVVRSHRRRRQR